MRSTLLDMTQNILSAMSSDEVNSIGDTAESLQVAHIIKNKYFDIIARGDLTEHQELFQLNPSLDGDSPVQMFVPDGIAEIQFIKYFDTSVSTIYPDGFIHDLNVDITPSDADDPISAEAYKYINILPVKEFIHMVNRFNPKANDVESFTFKDSYDNKVNEFTFYFKNNKQPQYCTILSNYYVVFDSYDQAQENTLQASKTMCFGQVIPLWRMEDSFIPDLDDNQFPLLLNEAKSLAFYELKQQPHVKADQEIKRQWSTVQRNKSVVNRPTYFNQIPSYGRRGSYGHTLTVGRAPNHPYQ